MTEQAPRGLISFVGAGPGASDLLTLRGQDRLKRAGMVIYAGSLVPEDMLQVCAADCTLITSADKHLDAIVSLMHKAAQSGLRVVRLHSGDTSLYSALSEQQAHLSPKLYDIEIVPGVTAFSAVAASAGIELTRPGGPQSVILTRPGQDGSELPKAQSLPHLATLGTTLCLHLAGKRLISNLRLLADSYGENCNALIASQVSTPEESLLRGSLGDLLKEVNPEDFRKAVMVIVTPGSDQTSGKSALYDAHYHHLYRP